MLRPEQLKDFLHRKGLSRLDQLLIVLSSGAGPTKVADIKKIAASGGLRKANSWNVSDVLSRGKGLAVSVPGGWELTATGRSHVVGLVGAPESRIQNVASSIRAHLAQVTSPAVKKFLEEAASCFEHGYYRAAIVLSWAGAVSVLHERVIAHHLSAFNAEAARRTATSKQPWRPAVTADDLGEMKEHEFLQVIAAINIIGKNVKQLLENALKLRNSCGHPTSVDVAENMAASHLEVLILNVFTKF